MKKFLLILGSVLICTAAYSYPPDYRMTPGGRGGKMSPGEMEEAYKQCLDACNQQSSKRDYLDCYKECDRIFKEGKKHFQQHNQNKGRRYREYPNYYTGTKG